MITLRDAVLEDSLYIHKINSVSLGYDYSPERTKDRLAYIIGSPYYKFIVACDNGQVVGYIQGSDYDNTYFDSLKNIMGLAVLPQYQGKGIGKKLLLAIEAWAKESGSCGVRLVSGESRAEAHKFYTHMGYTMRKNQKNFVKAI